MAIMIQVITSNTHKDGGGFHEIHTCRFLSSAEHALDTVKNIIDRNLVYCGDCTLQSVEICTNRKDVAVFLQEYYNKQDLKDDGLTITIEENPDTSNW